MCEYDQETLYIVLAHDLFIMNSQPLGIDTQRLKDSL